MKQFTARRKKMIRVTIKDRVTKLKIDWFDIEQEELEKMLEDIKEEKNTYVDCDIIVNGVVRLSF